MLFFHLLVLTMRDLYLKASVCEVSLCKGPSISKMSHFFSQLHLLLLHRPLKSQLHLVLPQFHKALFPKASAVGLRSALSSGTSVSADGELVKAFHIQPNQDAADAKEHREKGQQHEAKHVTTLMDVVLPCSPVATLLDLMGVRNVQEEVGEHCLECSLRPLDGVHVFSLLATCSVLLLWGLECLIAFEPCHVGRNL